MIICSLEAPFQRPLVSAHYAEISVKISLLGPPCNRCEQRAIKFAGILPLLSEACRYRCSFVSIYTNPLQHRVAVTRGGSHLRSV